MSLRALIVRLLLALALVANGLPVAVAMPSDPMPAVADDGAPGSCHDLASAPEAAEPAAGMDCCDGGDCACDCLHHAPVLAPFAYVPGAPPRAGALRLPAAAPRATPPPLPSLRPPIGRA